MKLRYLDGLRGLAALVVVFNHLIFMYVPYAVNGGGEPHGLGPLLHNTPLQVLISGDLAVCLFFVLSGIVLSAKFFRTGEARFVVATAVKRYFRLAIPVLGSVLLAYGLVRLGWMYNQPAGALTSDWWLSFWRFPANWWEAVYQGAYGAFLADNNSYNPVLWTMKLEFLGSFLVFGTILLFGRMRNRWVVYLVLLVLLWQTYYPAFVLGVMMADYMYNNGRRVVASVLARGWWVLVLLGSLVLGAFPVTVARGTMYEHAPFLPVQAHVLAATGIIAAIMTSGWLQRRLMARPVLLLGRVSFPLYLLHFLVLGSYTSYLYVTLAHQMSLKAAMVVTVAPTLAMMISAAYVYAKYVDEPAIRLAGRIYQWWFGERAVAAQKEPGAEIALDGQSDSIGQAPAQAPMV